MLWALSGLSDALISQKENWSQHAFLGIDDIAAEWICPTSETWDYHMTKFVLFKRFVKIEEIIILLFCQIWLMVLLFYQSLTLWCDQGFFLLELLLCSHISWSQWVVRNLKGIASAILEMKEPPNTKFVVTSKGYSWLLINYVNLYKIFSFLDISDITTQ